MTPLDRLLLARADEQVRGTKITEIRGYRHAQKRGCANCPALVAVWSKSGLCPKCRMKKWNASR